MTGVQTCALPISPINVRHVASLLDFYRWVEDLGPLRVGGTAQHLLEVTMKAIRIHQYGDASTLKLEEIPRLLIADDQILIRIHDAGVNPIDWKIRQGYMMNFRNLLPDFAGGAAGAEGGWGELLCTTCSRGATALAAPVADATCCPALAAPHLSQNFASTEIGAPQPVQKRDDAWAEGSGRRVPHAAQNDCPSPRTDPHFTQLMLISAPLLVAAQDVCSTSS